MFGELVPEGGGDTIPLLKESLQVGRRESCDIVLRFSNISTHHCELMLEKGYWFVKDLGSRNGTKVNGVRITKKRLDPGDRLTIARHDYQVDYSPEELGADGPPPDEDVISEIMSRSLMDGAGLDRKQKQLAEGRVGRAKAAESQQEKPSSDQTDSDEPADAAASAQAAVDEEIEEKENE